MYAAPLAAMPPELPVCRMENSSVIPVGDLMILFEAVP